MANAELYFQEFSVAQAGRSTFESHWEEAAKFTLPALRGTFESNGMTRTPGQKHTSDVYDSTALIALPRFGAVMESMLTPRNSKWHRLAPLEDALRKDRATRLWLDAVTDLLFRYRYAPKANFSGQNGQNYLTLGALGTGCVFTDELADEPGLRYRAIHLGEIFFFENHQGIIDKAMRRFPLTVRQAAQKFGRDALSPTLQGKFGTKDQENEYMFLHVVEPRADMDPGRKDYRGKAFRSCYFEFETKKEVRESGYNTFPYSISRYTQSIGEVYGRSPAMEALPAIKTLNEQSKTMLRVGQRAVDPVLLAHDDGVLDAFSMRSGAMNYGAVNRDGRALVQALPTGNLAAGDKMMEYQRNAINDAFLMSLFQILTEGPQMTATEVLERVREKGILISPTMGRQQSEYLGPLIDRELDVLSMQGLLPPMPPALREAGGGYKVEYDSPLSRAQRAEEASGLMRTVEMALKVAVEAQNPEVLDHFEWDAIVPELADIEAVPARWLRSVARIAEIREGRMAEKETQTAIAAAPAMAAMTKSMGGGRGQSV